MTVIAWDGKTLAADKRATNSGLISTVTKIQRVGDRLVGFCGGLYQGLEMVEWFKNGADAKEFPAFQRTHDDWVSLLVIDSGRILKYERSPVPAVHEDQFIALGTGRDFAIAAMHCGKTAAEAVQIASIYQCDCGNGVDELAL